MSCEYSSPPGKQPTILHEEDETSEQAIEAIVNELNLDEFPDVLGTPSKAAYRVRQHREHTKHLTGTTPRIVPNWRAEFPAYIRRLKDWLKSPNASARKLRRHGRQIAEDWRIYQLFAAQLGRTPTATEFGVKLGLDRHRGRDRMRRLTAMETSGGPWA